MKRTEFKKHAAALLLMLCLLAVSALPAFATSANIKLTDRNGDPMTGTIRVRLYDEASQEGPARRRADYLPRGRGPAQKRRPEL